MSILDLKQRLHDVPGIETLSMHMAFGKQIYGFGNKTVSLPASASDIDVMFAIREAAKEIPAGTPAQPASGPSAADVVTPTATAGEASPVSGTSPATNNPQSAETVAADVPAPSPSASLGSPVNVTGSAPVTVQLQAPAMTTPTKPGAHALTVKDVLQSHGQKLDQILQAQIAKLQATLNSQVDTVVAGTDAVIAHAESQTAEFQAILGQISNLGTE
ncbi:hypothetical protein [Bradyrhizobium ivorense]|uniref:hypothetical protein n=1 Tax=Bradyrhizobium ivorense TaxID=2511166 RepID=UPI0010BB2056|nr:hypothetical protein [Bradyrhizobium ivorense]VIO73867.1 hypothetical protein CI41S_39760 [Bradyrhizobium ivorense]